MSMEGSRVRDCSGREIACGIVDQPPDPAPPCDLAVLAAGTELLRDAACGGAR